MSKSTIALIWILTVVVAVLLTWFLTGRNLSEEIRQREAEIARLEKEIEDLQSKNEELEDEREEAEKDFEEAKEQLERSRKEHAEKVAELNDEISRLRRNRRNIEEELKKLEEEINKAAPSEVATSLQTKLRLLGDDYSGAVFELFPQDVFEQVFYKTNDPGARGALFALTKVEQFSGIESSYKQEITNLEELVASAEKTRKDAEAAVEACEGSKELCDEQLRVAREIELKLKKALGLSKKNVRDLDRALRWARAKKWLQTIGAGAAGYLIGDAVD